MVKSVADLSTVIGKQSKKEISKRDVQLVDQSGMVVNLTLWGTDVRILYTILTLVTFYWHDLEFPFFTGPVWTGFYCCLGTMVKFSVVFFKSFFFLSCYYIMFCQIHMIENI